MVHRPNPPLTWAALSRMFTSGLELWIFQSLKIIQLKSLYKLRNFYSKSSYAWGLPILASKSVKDAALKEACENVYIMLADRADVRQQVNKNGGQFGVLGEFEKIRQVPEYSYLPSHYDRRARGIGPAYKYRHTHTKSLIKSCVGNLSKPMCRRNLETSTDNFMRRESFMHIKRSLQRRYLYSRARPRRPSRWWWRYTKL